VQWKNAMQLMELMRWDEQEIEKKDKKSDNPFARIYMHQQQQQQQQPGCDSSDGNPEG
jgi:hypothetical protein